MSYFRKEKDLKYYVRVFVSGVLAVFLVSLTSEFFQWPAESFMEALRGLAYVPFFLVILLYFYDRLAKRVLGKRKPQKTDEQEFLMHTSKKVMEELQYGKEEFKKLQEDEKFQTFYQDVFFIYQNGESEAMNFDNLEKRFSEDDFAYDAVNVVIRETKNLMEKKKRESSGQDKNQGDE